MNKIFRYLGGVSAIVMGGFFLYVLFTEMLWMPATTDFSKIMKPVDIILFIALASISIGAGIACFKEEVFDNEKPVEKKVFHE